MNNNTYYTLKKISKKNKKEKEGQGIYLFLVNKQSIYLSASFRPWSDIYTLTHAQIEVDKEWKT